MAHEVISIAGFDPLLTEELSRGRALKRVHVVLTQAPSEAWIALFEAGRQAARRKASVEAHVVGDYIAFESPAEAIERHMRDLAADVAGANAALAEANAPAPAQPAADRVDSPRPPESDLQSLAEASPGAELPSPA